VLLETRAPRGLLGGMLGLPSTEWSADPPAPRPPVAADWRDAGAEVRHTFTHFHLRLGVAWARVPPPPEGRLYPLTPALAEALPTVMRKALRLGLAAAGIAGG
jgi:A/G-specific adenine glycosylase